MRTGGELVVDMLAANGVDQVHAVPGESYLPVLDALHDRRDSIRLITCRHEGAAAVMAEAYGKLTGRPGVCLVTRGPGACNATIGLHTAFQDSTPMILLIGQVARGDMEREAFQEIDYRRMLGPLTKWVAEVDSAARIPEYLGRALSVAMAGRPGPVALALPEDVLAEATDAVATPPVHPPSHGPGPGVPERLADLLARAERPLLLAGGPRWGPAERAALVDLADRLGLPVATSFRAQDLFDNLHPLYAGDVGIGINPALAALVREADLILAVGPRLGEMTTSGYTLLTPPRTAQTLVHVHPDPEELNRVYQADLPICATMAGFLATAGVLRRGPVAPDWAKRARAAWTAWQQPGPCPGPVHLPTVLAALRDRLPANAIVSNGAGNFAAWLHRFFPHRGLKTQLAPTSGAMGYGLPAALAAKALHPDREVVAWLGDGEFQMTSQELATAVQFRLPVTVIVVDNGMWGTIRMHQEMRFPGRVHGTTLVNPDFAALAQAYGAAGERVDDTAAFAPALDRALAANREGRPALIHLPIDPDALSPRTTLTALRGG